MTTKYKLVLVRHGESQYNQKNLFCGWYDADLSDTGIKEAQYGGQVSDYFVCLSGFCSINASRVSLISSLLI